MKTTSRRTASNTTINAPGKLAMTQQVSASGENRAVDPSTRKIKLFHQPIEAWSMDAVQMPFRLAPEIDITSLKPGMNIHFSVHSPSTGTFIITRVIAH